MATNTTNYNLMKQNEEEFYDVNVVNANLDKIDTAIKQVEEAATNIDLTEIEQSISNVQQEVDAHLGEIATETKAGHFKVGNGLRVASDGKLSTYNHFRNDITLDNMPTDFDLGVTTTIVLTGINTLYQQLTELIKELLGYTFTVENYRLRFFMNTIKRSDSMIFQEVECQLNNNNSIGMNIFTLTRSTNYTAPITWQPWRVEVNTLTGTNSPVNTVYALKGCLYHDLNSGITYTKTEGTSTITTSGWKPISQGDSNSASEMAKHNQFLDNGVKKQLAFGVNKTLNCLTVSISEVTE